MKHLQQSLRMVIFWLVWPINFLYFRLGGYRTRLLLMNGDRILVVKNRIHDGRWSLPGGGIHRGEAPFTAVMRELKEEVVLDTAQPRRVRRIGEAVYSANGHRFPFHCFVGEIAGECPTELKCGYELAEARWVPCSQLNSTTAGPDVMLSLQAWRHAN